jgi:hypothetical protein
MTGNLEPEPDVVVVVVPDVPEVVFDVVVVPDTFALVRIVPIREPVESPEVAAADGVAALAPVAALVGTTFLTVVVLVVAPGVAEPEPNTLTDDAAKDVIGKNNKAKTIYFFIFSSFF